MSHGGREKEEQSRERAPKSSAIVGGDAGGEWWQTELELLFWAMEFRWEKVRLEREKKERKIGEADGVAGGKKKERKRRVGSTQPGLF